MSEKPTYCFLEEEKELLMKTRYTDLQDQIMFIFQKLEKRDKQISKDFEDDFRSLYVLSLNYERIKKEKSDNK